MTLYTSSRTITVPSNLNRGQTFWLGTVIDRNGSLSEMTEADNAAYIPTRINQCVSAQTPSILRDAATVKRRGFFRLNLRDRVNA